MQRMYVVPRYDPVYVEPNLKEYETQVLQMSVPVDDNDSYNDLQLDFSNKNHAFSLDNVSYITKENGESTGALSFSLTSISLSFSTSRSRLMLICGAFEKLWFGFNEVDTFDANRVNYLITMNLDIWVL